MHKTMRTITFLGIIFFGIEAAAETTLTTRFSSLSLVTGGETYTGTFGTSLTAEFDITENIYGSASLLYLTYGSTFAFGLGGAIGYMFVNDLDSVSGTGTKLGVGATLSGVLQLAGRTAMSPDIIVDYSLGTAGSSSLIYGVGVEYVPLGLVIGYDNLSFSNYDLEFNGVSVGYRSRF